MSQLHRNVRVRHAHFERQRRARCPLNSEPVRRRAVIGRSTANTAVSLAFGSHATQSDPACDRYATATRVRPRKSVVFRSPPFALLRKAFPCTGALFAPLRCTELVDPTGPTLNLHDRVQALRKALAESR